MPLAIGFFILFMVTSLIIFYKDCDSFVEYLFSTIVGVVLSAFFAIQETYSPIPVLGVSINNGDPTWRLCEVDNNVRDLYSVDEGYKIRLKICNEFGGRTYYQSDFLSLLKSGHIVYCPDENKYEIKHIVCAEKISDGAILIHEFDSVEEV